MEKGQSLEKWRYLFSGVYGMIKPTETQNHPRNGEKGVHGKAEKSKRKKKREKRTFSVETV